MANQKSYKRKTQKESSKGAQVVVVFFLVFVIVIIAVFVINNETIKKNYDLFRTQITSRPGAEDDFFSDEELQEEPVIRDTPPVVAISPAPDQSTQQTQTQSLPPQEPQQTQTPVPAVPSAQAQTSQTQSPPPPELPQPVIREREIYFAQVSNDGQILHSGVTRRIPVSGTPMLDVLNAVLAGPTTDEISRNILNFVPQNTRVLRAEVRGSTAYISFSEDFLFNTFGVEGYVAQLRQVVWTVTEFPNVSDVQILIEGRRLDYLGEGIWIGSPIGRQSF